MKNPRKTFLMDVQTRSTEQDTAGQPKEIWTTVRKEWASIDSINGREYFNASGERATVTHRIRVPYGSVKARDRLLYRGTAYDIRSVMIDGRDLEIMAVEVA